MKMENNEGRIEFEPPSVISLLFTTTLSIR